MPSRASPSFDFLVSLVSAGIGFLEHLWGPSPLLVRRGAEVAQRADRGAAHKGIFPSFGWEGCVKPTAALWIVLCSCSGARGATVHTSRWRDRAWPWVSSLSYVRMGPPFICSRGYPQVAAQGGAKMGEWCSGYSCLHSGDTVLSNLTLMAKDKGIKCPSASPRRCREVDRQERHRLPRWLLCQLRFATACPWLHNLPPRAPGMPPERHVGG